MSGEKRYVYQYDPTPVDDDAEAAKWRQIRREGGHVVNAEGEVIGTFGPAVENDDGEELVEFRVGDS